MNAYIYLLICVCTCMSDITHFHIEGREQL